MKKTFIILAASLLFACQNRENELRERLNHVSRSMDATTEAIIHEQEKISRDPLNYSGRMPELRREADSLRTVAAYLRAELDLLK